MEPWALYERGPLSEEEHAQIRHTVAEWNEFRDLAAMMRAAKRFMALSAMVAAIGLAAGFWLASTGIVGGAGS